MRRFVTLMVSITLVVNLLFSVVVRAEDALVPPDILITEVSPGYGSLGKEFVELYNNDHINIDLSGWKLCKPTASGSCTTYATIPAFTSPLTPGGRLVLATAEAGVSSGVLIANANLSNAGGYLRLIIPGTTNTTVDEIRWGSSILVPTSPMQDCQVESASIDYANEKSYKRMQNVAEGTYIDTDLIYTDFCIGLHPTPGQDDGVHVSDIAPPVVEPEPEPTPDPQPEPEPTPDPDPSPSPDPEPTPEPGDDSDDPSDPTTPPSDDNSPGDPSTDTPPADNNPDPSPTPDPGMGGSPTQPLPIYLSELLVDPESPLTDSQDEFIELFNPNTTEVNLKKLPRS